MKKSSQLLLSSLLIGLILLICPLGNYPVQALSPTFQHLTLTWMQDPHTTQVITWKTDCSINNSFLQYTEAKDKAVFLKKALKVKANSENFTTDLGLMRLHTVMLTDLKPGVTYLYRVGNKKEWSEFHTFTTEAENLNSFKFLVFGDSQSGDAKNPEYQPWMITCQNAFRANPDARFFVNVGDLVEEGQNYAHWKNWFAATQGVIDTISFVPVVGNHETYVPNTRTNVQPFFWLKQFKVPQNGPKNLQSQAYSFDYGNVHFTILDSQGKEQQFLGDILQLQKTWLENDLKNTKQKWKIVFFHKPIYSNSPRKNEDVAQAFQPILDKYQVNLVLNGHDHVVARTYPLYNNQLANSSGQGIVYYTTGRSGNKSNKNVVAKLADAFFYNPEDQPNYLAVSVTSKRLLIKNFKQDGTLLDSYTIDKPDPLIL